VVEKYGLSVVEQKNLTLNGMPVIALVADQADEQSGQKIRILTYFISYQKLIFTFHGLAELSDFDSQVPMFNQTMRNFKTLSDPAKINKKPERISIKTASKAASLQTLLKEAKVPDDRLSEHALINGMTLEQNVGKGGLFKVILK
jgi:predicted Zn-dependent protease